MKCRLFKLINGIALLCLCNSAMASLIDFTDSSMIGSLTPVANGYSGTVDGVGFTLTSTDGNVNFKQSYDGSASEGCQSNGGVLACDKDGTGINDDEIAGIGADNQKLTLTFDREVSITGFYFLDLYVNPNGSGAKEQATITLDGTFFDTVAATGSNGDGGYADLETAPVLARTIDFTALTDPAFWDDFNNDYALAGVNVSAVPLPPTIWLMVAAFAGFAGVRRAVN